MLTSFAAWQPLRDLPPRARVNLKAWICKVVEEGIRVQHFSIDQHFQRIFLNAMATQLDNLVFSPAPLPRG